MTQRREKGFTLLELLLVLAIGALIIAGSVFVYNAATISRGATATVQLINAVRAEAQASFGAGGDYTGMDTAFFQTVGIINPAGVHAFNGTIDIAEVAGAPAVNYTITLNGVPGEACVKIGNVITDAGVVTVGDGAATVDPNNVGAGTTLAQEIAALCDADEVDMVYTLVR